MTRVVAFVLILAAAFAAAAAVGQAVGPFERGAASPHAEEPEEQHAAGLSIELVSGPSHRFRVLDEDGEPVEAFDVLHERPMHLIVVRRDLTGFMHLHPKLGRDGTWFVPLALPEPGTWVAFADFSTGGERATLATDLHTRGSFEPRPLPPPSRTAQAGPYRVELHADAGRLEFRVKREGRPVAVDRYLGARGHLVILREGDLEYLHAHAEEDELAFETEFPSPGRYRLFLQFKASGSVRTAEFTVRQ